MNTERLVSNFYKYIEALLARVGLHRCRILGKRHDGEITEVAVTIRGSKHHKHSTHSEQIGRARTIEELTRMLLLRLNRLLKHANFKFGRIVIEVTNAAIAKTRIRVDNRRDEGGIDRFFVDRAPRVQSSRERAVSPQLMSRWGAPAMAGLCWVI